MTIEARIALTIILGTALTFSSGGCNVRKGIDPELWQRSPALAMRRLLAVTRPDIEVTRTDDGVGSITLRDRRSAKETTITFDAARNGKFTVSGLPAWVPEYPGQVTDLPESSDPRMAPRYEAGGEHFSTRDDPSKVIAFYQDKAKEMGAEVKAAPGQLLIRFVGPSYVGFLTVAVNKIPGSQTNIDTTWAGQIAR